jgi:hypothetical protein
MGIVEFLLHAGNRVTILDPDGDSVVADRQISGTEILGQGQDHPVRTGEIGTQAKTDYTY